MHRARPAAGDQERSESDRSVSRGLKYCQFPIADFQLAIEDGKLAINSMLSLQNVSVNYGAIEALTGISMHVNEGEVVTLIGANGAGKTTTLRTITGLLQPRDGKITFEEEDISGKPT